MSNYQLAQINVATIKAPLDSPIMADFVANLDRINALAEAAPGFIWRLKTDEGNATALHPFGEDIIVNMSVWDDIAALQHYVYRSAHVDVMRRRREWFERMDVFMVLWWVPAGHIPTEAEAGARLELLKRHGPTAEAFTFRQAFPPPDTRPTIAAYTSDAACPA